jgi:phage terminase large subunit-like protein
MGTWRFDTTGSDYDTVLHVRDGVCGATVLGCDDDGCRLDRADALVWALGELMLEPRGAPLIRQL